MPQNKPWLLWGSAFIMALTISCAAPTRTTKPETMAPTPEITSEPTVAPTPEQPEATPTPVSKQVPMTKRSHPPADSGPRYTAKQPAAAQPPEQPASTLWARTEQMEKQSAPAEPTGEEGGTVSSAPSDQKELTDLQPAAPLDEAAGSRSAKSGNAWLVVLGGVVVLLAAVIWMAGRRRQSAAPARQEEPRHPGRTLTEARPVERPVAASETRPAPLVVHKPETGKQMVLPTVAETESRPVVRVAASAKKTATRRKTVARKPSRSRTSRTTKTGTRRAAAARRSSTASSRRKVISLTAAKRRRPGTAAAHRGKTEIIPFKRRA
ncbi:MAG: hypothetical protein AB1439_06240 [candidate division FCPU426 bacterium]